MSNWVHGSYKFPPTSTLNDPPRPTITSPLPGQENTEKGPKKKFNLVLPRFGWDLTKFIPEGVDLEKYDDSHVTVDEHFTAEELQNMSCYDKRRLTNLKKNYLFWELIKLPSNKKPYFMNPRWRETSSNPFLKGHPMPSKYYKKLAAEFDDDEPDPDWKPSSCSNRKKQATKRKWMPPWQEKAPPSKKSKLVSTADQFVPGSAVVPDTSEPNKVSKAAAVSSFSGAAKKSTLVSTTSQVVNLTVGSFRGFDDLETAELKKEIVDSINMIDDCLMRVEPWDDEDDLANNVDYFASLFGETPEELGLREPSKKPIGSGIEKRRYPKRNIERIHYEDPDEDSVLYCMDCGKDYMGYCPEHDRDLIMVQDTKPPEGSKDRAKDTAPEFIEIRKSVISGNGAWAIQRITTKHVFGPYKGTIIDCFELANKSGCAWQISKTGERPLYVDGGNTSDANWMRYVNSARCEGEQNIFAYQYRGSIFYRPLRTIETGHELLTWYGNDYGRELGLVQPNVNMVDLLEKCGERHTCEFCNRCYSARKFLLDHQKRCRPADRTNVSQAIVRKSSQKSTQQTVSNGCGNAMETGIKKGGHVCDDCGKTMSSLSSLKQHRRIHSGEKPFCCPHCEYRAGHSSHLQRHIRYRHTHEKRFVCKVCGAEFVQRSDLRRHERRHTGEKPYSCPHCEYRTGQSGDLQGHIRHRHTHEKRYACKACGKSFVRPGELRTHERTHTGEKPYSCQHCEYRSTQSSALTRHMRQMHSGKR